MSNLSPSFIVLAAAALVDVGCRTPTNDDVLERAITEDFAHRYARRLSDPVAALAHSGADLPPDLLTSNRVVLVEVSPRKGGGRTIFEDTFRRPPGDRMTTQVPYAHNIGLYYPASLQQEEIEIRVNYFCDVGNFVAVHVVVPNPLLIRKAP